MSMTTREYVLEVLTRLKPYWPMAEGLLQIVSQKDIDDAAIKGLLAIFQQVFDETVDSVQKAKLGTSLTALQKIQALEQKERREEAEELAAVEKLIADI